MCAATGAAGHGVRALSRESMGATAQGATAQPLLRHQADAQRLWWGAVYLWFGQLIASLLLNRPLHELHTAPRPA
jgi:hypothetical protein